MADPRSEDDRITPVSGFPAARSITPRLGERGPHATLEVNANVALGDEDRQSPVPAWDAPTPKPVSARATRIMGSPLPPMVAPGSRRTPRESTESDDNSRSATRYRYVSTPPPAGSPSSGPHSVSITPRESAPVLRNARPPTRPEHSPHVVRAAAPWRADLSLLPESRRGLCDELYPLAVDGCWVVGVLATEGAEARSRLASEVALALAESGHPRVLLIDADFEHVLVQRFMRVEMPLAGSFSEQLHAREPRRWTVVECVPSLHVLAESTRVAHGPLPREAFAACVDELRAFYDLVVIDGPLLGDEAGCDAVRSVVDSVVFSHGRYGPSEITRVRSLFPSQRISLVPAVG